MPVEKLAGLGISWSCDILSQRQCACWHGWKPQASSCDNLDNM